MRKFQDNDDLKEGLLRCPGLLLFEDIVSKGKDTGPELLCVLWSVVLAKACNGLHDVRPSGNT